MRTTSPPPTDVDPDDVEAAEADPELELEIPPAGEDDEHRQIDPQFAAELLEHYGLTCPPRWGTRRNFDRQTLGGKVAKVARLLGTPFMPWQRYVVDTALEIDPETGFLFYRGVDLTVPRQSGKTSLILPVAVHRANAWQSQRIVYMAQTGTLAREKWEDEHTPLLERSKAFKGKFRVRKANAREAWIWTKTRSIHGLSASRESSGHGRTLDLALLDEYFAQIDLRQDQAVGPAMITRDGAQKWRLSTSGTSRSVPFNAMRARGRRALDAGRPTRFAFFDWCGLKSQPRDDPRFWLECMPALCPAPIRGRCQCSAEWRHTVLEPAIWAELEDMADEPEEFDRAYRNIPREDGELEVDPHVPTVDSWERLADPTAPRGPVLALAVDVTPMRDHAAISAVGETPDGRLRAVVLAYGEGTKWIMPTLKRLYAQLKPVAVALDEASPAAFLIVRLRDAGVPRMSRDAKEQRHGALWIPTAPEIGASCASFADAVTDGAITHTKQREMSMALGNARSRTLGDGGFAWARKLADGDICPLVSVTLALGAYERFKHLRPSSGPNIW